MHLLARLRRPLDVPLAAVVFALAAPESGAQRKPSLIGAFQEYQQEFTSITAVRELRDGTVLVIDNAEKKLLGIRDPAAAARQIGRVGDGPEEYQSPRFLLPLAGDTTLGTDGTTRRWFLLVGQSIRKVVPNESAIVQLLGTKIWGADGRGALLGLRGFAAGGVRNVFRSVEQPTSADSTLVLRAWFSVGSIDTVARLKGGWSNATRVMRHIDGMDVTYVLASPFVIEEQVAMCRDGSIAVAVTSPARIDWITPAGSRVRGKPMPVQPLATTEALKRSAVQHFMSPRVAAMFTPKDFPPWPKQLPPFTRDGLFCLPGGDAIVQRYDPTDAPPTYDIVGRDGRPQGTIQLPARARIVAVGKQSLYVAIFDEDDLLHLRRYALVP